VTTPTPAQPADQTVESEEADEAGLRQCALSRARLPREALIRFVAGPGDVMVPDLAARLPGRGVWVEATRKSVAEAVRRNVFARSLKRQVTAPSDLADRVEALLLERARQALSFANKAGLVTAGFSKVEAMLGSGKAETLISASDGAADGTERLARKFRAVAAAGGRPAFVITVFTAADLGLAIGRGNVIHAALAVGGQGRSMRDAALRLQRYRLSDLSSNQAAPGDVPAAAIGSGTDQA
jgi:hypothetical protein